MRTSERKINKTLKTQIQKVFAQTVCDFKGVENTQSFLKDFFTDSEYETFAKRLAVAYWLKKGRSYENIKENLKVSSATIATVQTMLAKEGFQKALQKIEAEEWASTWSERIKKFVP